jgi:thiol-disulfide isomerase/thioredoxin
MNIKTMNKWKISTVVLALVAIVLAAFLVKDNFDSVSPKVAAQKAVDYINKNLTSTPGTFASVDKGTAAFYKFYIEINSQKYPSFVSTDGKLLIPYDSMDISKASSPGTAGSNQPEMVAKASTDVEGNFKAITDENVCTEDGKPIIYFFESTTCPHCQWEKPVLEGVVKEFGSAVSFHESIDGDKDTDVFSKYSSGSVPTLVIGCKYWRVGSGESQGADTEKENLTKVICRATGNQPESLCK